MRDCTEQQDRDVQDSRALAEFFKKHREHQTEPILRKLISATINGYINGVRDTERAYQTAPQTI